MKCAFAVFSPSFILQVALPEVEHSYGSAKHFVKELLPYVKQHLQIYLCFGLKETFQSLAGVAAAFPLGCRWKSQFTVLLNHTWK